MKTASLTSQVTHKDNKPHIQALLETPFSKEIRIVFKKGQIMKEHSAHTPIVVEIFKGEIDFGVNNEIHQLTEGDILTLNGKVPHDLKATKDSIVRLSLSKKDAVERVFSVIR
ncbi:cupin [Carboxylicivirga sp. M1479]|uniref:cupin n=1 Tax=Carboxylicivirga sp. M1479 TaxID=2594476 RepID=UPI001177B124|nr:cupin [Carboxylicivirga sp. M1479]TRX71192.1 cupin [Carboxylicivirga sp. M1479]